MCRMFGFIGKGSNDVSCYLKDFRELAKKGKVRKGASDGHENGWGVVYYKGSKAEYAGREDVSAMDRRDPRGHEKYENACKKIDSIRPQIILAHLRKSSDPEWKGIENTHPFVDDMWSFCHNGTIKKFEVGDFKEPVEGMKGSTDSERFFKLLIAKVKNGKNMLEAIKELIKHMKENYKGTTSLTFLLSDGDYIYGYRDFKNDEDYYTLFYFKEDDHVVFSQEKLCTDKNWIEVKNGELVRADRNLRVEPVRL